MADHRLQRGPAKGGGWSILKIPVFTVYIIQSEKNNKYYVGYTSDIKDRLRRHNSGMNKSTKPYMPWNLKHAEEFKTKHEAWLREQQIKAYKGGEAFKSLINK